MITAAEVKDLLKTDDIVDLLYELNAEPIKRNGEVHCRTICHGGDKHKLIYFPESNNFSCFTGNCGQNMDIFVLVGRIFNLDFPTSFRYICGKFNIRNEGSFNPADMVDTGFIKKFKKKEPEHKLSAIPTIVLNRYYNLQHKLWVEDGISLKTMRKFDILFSIRENKIIIPHFDIENRLLGVRGRALNQDEIDNGKKYMPVYHPKYGVLKHATGGNLYGINVNKEKIKETKSVILVEAEKGVQQIDSFNFTIPGLGVSGSSLSDEQIKILVDLGVENVVLSLDKEFEEVGSQEELFYKKKIMSSFLNKLMPYFHVSIIWDKEGLIDHKSSPTDYGLEIFKKMYNSRIIVT